MSYLPCVEVEPATPATAAVIWLHGLGADGHDFEAIVPELHLPQDAGVRFIFPHAPSMPVTINNGYVMPAWYDILDIAFDRKVDEAQLLQSAAAVHALIDREIERGIDSQRIVIAGFSQGGAVGYQAALSYPKPLAGLLAMSTYFATHASIKVHSANQNLPIQIYHGTQDPVVPEPLGRQAVSQLADHQLSAHYSTYPMQHSVCLEQIRDIAAWLKKTLLA
ncbi:Carboxylesterase [gamma proteobacterium IMCC2047]|nr:Carboxylesterase [gamma proteobacterium IMCC2047]